MAAEGLGRLDLAKRESVPAEISRLLIDYMLSGNVRPGGRLPSERQLADSLGVGRSAVREALKSLSLLGLLEVRQGDGTYLRSPDSELLPQVIEWGLLLGERRTLEMVEARRLVEIGVARLAAERRTAEDLQQLGEILKKMSAAQDAPTFVEADVEFHLRLAQAAGNSVLTDVLRSIQELLRVWIRRVIDAERESAPSYMEHELIFIAVRDQDVDTAASAMREHMDAATARLLKAVESHGANIE